MKRKALVFFLLVAASLLLGTTVFVECPRAEDVNLKFSSPWPPKHPMHTMVIGPWAQKIKDLTGGRVTITLFPGQALGKAADQYEMAAKGICDIALTIPAYTPGRFQLGSVFMLPFMVTTAEATSVAYWKTYEKYFTDEFKDVKVLWLYVHAPGQIFTRKKPFKTLADLKGMKIRATNPYIQQSLKVLGASPVSIPVPEVYSSLERGVVDGTAMPFEGMWVFKQYEVVDYGTMCNLYTMTFAIVMNKKRWDALPADVKKIFEENIGLGMSRKSGIVYDKTEAALKTKVIESGVKINDLPSADLDSWKNEGDKISQNWAKEMEAKGLPGNAVLKEARSLLGMN
jgi:TRAP-type C4-dicarboxylate transport system substrate-binding protein